MNSREALCLRTFALVGLAALLEFTLGISVASATTLIMPNRQALMGTPIVVWGNTTQANGTADSIDCGNGTVIPGPTVTDQSYIAANCTYAAAGTFNATLTVGAEVATAVITVSDPALLSAFDLRATKVNMAIEDGLRFLYFNQNNRAATFATNMTSWSNLGSFYTTAFSGMVVLAIQNHGHAVNGPATDIYQPVVQRGLNFLFNTVVTQDMTPCSEGGAAPPLNPCIGAQANNNIGLKAPLAGFSGYDGYVTPIITAAVAAAASVAPARTVGAGIGDATYVAGQPYSVILQRLANVVSWGQADGANAFGWYYYVQPGNLSDGSTLGWAMLGLENAQAAGALVPPEVRSRLATTLNGQLNTDGSLSYQYHGVGVNGTGSMSKAGIGLQGLSFSGALPANPQVVAAVGYISKNWESQVDPSDGFFCSGNNKGCGYAMFNNFKGLRLYGIQTLPGVTRAAGPGPIPANDWYADYVDNLLANQLNATTPTGGDWNAPSMVFSSQINEINGITALAVLILAPTAFVAPTVLTLGPANQTAAVGGNATVTATATTGAAAPAPGSVVTFVVTAGPNAGPIVCSETGTNTNTTNAAGQATCTYHDNGGAGSDTVQANIGLLLSNTVTVVWSGVGPPPASTNIPTLSEWGLIVMAGLLGLMGLWAVGRRKGHIG